MSEAPEVQGHHDDEIHMPPNSWWPMIVAVGVTVSMLGLITIDTLSPVFFVGLLILAGGIGGWVKDARSEYRELH